MCFVTPIFFSLESYARVQLINYNFYNYQSNLLIFFQYKFLLMWFFSFIVIDCRMESFWVQTAIGAIHAISFVCDVITFPVYLMLQKPWKRRQLAKCVKVINCLKKKKRNILNVQKTSEKQLFVFLQKSRGVK